MLSGGKENDRLVLKQALPQSSCFTSASTSGTTGNTTSRNFAAAAVVAGNRGHASAGDFKYQGPSFSRQDDSDFCTSRPSTSGVGWHHFASDQRPGGMLLYYFQVNQVC